ncbi:MAG: hypothetical protein OXM03_04895 [Chloroflexota bacterium]|nr:hypothetical protein [Chloroflexota bacterium]MDE2839945.1 hypothetical protein [Chloroflexota bacterium]MDE2931429.1 hypothetical protein [Chloroflexota bacterium]
MPSLRHTRGASIPLAIPRAASCEPHKRDTYSHDDSTSQEVEWIAPHLWRKLQENVVREIEGGDRIAPNYDEQYKPNNPEYRC